MGLTQTPSQSQKSNKKRIVIVGGGFAGINLGRQLKDQDVEIIMLDKHNYHTFQPLLYQVAIGAIESDAVGFPLRRIFSGQKNFAFHMAEVQKINPEANTISTSIGDVPYDYLVIATGSNTNFFGNKEMEHFTMPMKSIPEALNIRSLVLQNLEQAMVTSDPAEREALLTFVVAGGGPTGVELSGAFAEMRQNMLRKDFPGFDVNEMKIYLAEGKPKLIAAMSEQASVKSKEFLTDMGVTIYNGVHVQSYDGLVLKIDNGVTLNTRNVFWTAGVRGEVPDGLPPEAITKGTRLQTDEVNRVKGYSNIFAIGDVAAVITSDTPNGHPGVAPVAIQQGAHLAKNIVHLIKGEDTEPFKYHDKGSLATIGRNRAVADLGKFKFQGFFAWILWLFVHIMSLAGFSNKLIVFFTWLINYFSKNTDNRMVVRYFDTKTMMTDPVAK
ncbi:NAD(P)/FAD-dependent oxidoreductase [Mucilaginibacter robiniae]|uniref:NADH:ubiquinone reductase (non-electrogenic) n=1 Tax=Mucilaginibacter robiniae TaxID=2728022 RepID=A0A7L5E6E0_9SPHI|nr:NAD(P)/FAD-dependent oxidoreductase [Mucilaginibacter robiniae]QJD97899.1 NAD(P)/FAD-dependent oxidoreductase [Mucilaginibacter robiniae]